MRSILSLVLLLSPLPANAEVSQMDPVGAATYRWGPLRLYKAELFAPAGEFSWDSEFELRLSYKTSFSATTLANASLKEMARLSGAPISSFEPLRESLVGCFADVRQGDVIIGRSTSENTAVFYFNGSELCSVQWSGFRRSFFGIWLSNDARYKREGERLRGRVGG